MGPETDTVEPVLGAGWLGLNGLQVDYQPFSYFCIPRQITVDCLSLFISHL